MIPSNILYFKSIFIEEFSELLKYVLTLRFDQKPDYEYISKTIK
jgi:hypothetical protein